MPCRGGTQRRRAPGLGEEVLQPGLGEEVLPGELPADACEPFAQGA